MKGAASMLVFSEVDINGDGVLDVEEFTAGRDAHIKAMHEQFMQGSIPPGGGKGMHHGMGHQMPTFADLDLNGDGCINAEEFAKHQASHHAQRHGQAPPAPKDEGETESDSDG